MFHQTLYYRRRTRGTAGVQKHLGLPSGNRYLKLLLQGLKVIKTTAITAITKPR